VKKINDWDQYKQLILSELEANKSFRKEMRDILNLVREDVSGLKAKALVAGGLAGIIGTGLVSMILSFWK